MSIADLRGWNSGPGRYTYEYPHPAVTVDCVLFGYRPHRAQLAVILVRRKDQPFKGRWALPGGFVSIDESIEAAAYRELREETGLQPSYLEQLYTFGDPMRDPRERVIAVAHYALVAMDEHSPTAGSDADSANWCDVTGRPDGALAFDHEDILNTAIGRLRAKIRYEPVAFSLLPKRFTLPELQALYETVLGLKLDRSNFAKAALKLGVLKKRGQKKKGPAGRPAVVYEYDSARYERMKKQGKAFAL